MKPHIFLLSIGPVQSFIAQARKTQDLFAGSQLISSLARRAYQLFTERIGEGNHELLFPAFEKHSNDIQISIQSNPNRFGALVAASITPQQLRTIGNEVKQNLNNEFIEESLSRMAFLSQETRHLAQIQLASHLEITWSAIPITDGDYTTAFRALEAHNAGVKSHRNWEQSREIGRKCSIDGQRNVILYRRSAKEPNDKYVPKLFLTEQQSYLINAADEAQVKVWELQPGEGLSAVTFAKRTFAQEPHKFPSTARVCLMHVIEKIKDWEEFKPFDTQRLDGNWPLGHSDDHLLYEENLSEAVFMKSGFFGKDKDAANQAVEDTKKKHKLLMDKMKAEGIEQSLNTKYYAILIFDGDDMGNWLQGNNLVDPSQLKPFHQTLKDRLKDFGKWAMEYLSEPRGKTVYAGGDDFLGFVNVNSLFEVLKEMKKQFDALINKPMHLANQGFTIAPEEEFTFSAGIAIGHYKQPLGMVLEETRNAEKVAKKAGKNAFSISIMRHSGGVTRCVQSFAGDSAPIRIQEMQTICDQLARNFSNKFIHNIIAESRLWKSLPKADLFNCELKRLLKRAKAKETSDNEMKKVEQAIDQLLIPLPTDECKGHKINDLENFTSTLRICDFIYRINSTDNE